MGSAIVAPTDLMITIINEHSKRSMWTDSPLEGYKQLGGNTTRGEVGEEFIARYLTQSGIAVERRGSRVAPVDLEIAGWVCEVKTASQGETGTFQFNHVRRDTPYQYLLCLGVCPSQLVFGAWTKEDVEQGRAGTLVHMAQRQRTTLKLTKKLADLRPIEELVPWVNAVLMGGG